MADESNTQEPEVPAFKPVKIDKETPVIVNMPAAEERNIRQQSLIRKMIENKSIKKEERKQAVLEDQNINELGLDVILSRDNFEYYNEKKRLYLESYPELSDPFDLNDLHMMIVEEIFLRNLLKKKRMHPTANIDKDYAASAKRLREFKQSLAMRRADRTKTKEGKKILNIASLSINLTDKDKFSDLQEKLMASEHEEESLFDNGKIIE